MNGWFRVGVYLSTLSLFIENPSKIFVRCQTDRTIESERSRILSLAWCLDRYYLNNEIGRNHYTICPDSIGGEFMDSQTLIIVAITVVVCALIAAAAWYAVDKARSRRLREHFGPEYDRAVERMHDRNLAEAELRGREQRVEKYRIVPLSSQDRAHYRETWAAVQNRFVDDPQAAVKEGHRQIFEVMEKRGYPVGNFDQAADDLSVDYPEVVQNYRAASAIAERNRKGEAETEELRQALVHYRALFNELLEAPPSGEKPPKAVSSQRRPTFQFRGFRKSNRGGLRS
jgi:hypothetical protein